MNIACQLSARPNPRIGSNPILRTDPSPIEMAKRFDYSALANVRIFNDAIGSDANLIGQAYDSLKNTTNVNPHILATTQLTANIDSIRIKQRDAILLKRLSDLTL